MNGILKTRTFILYEQSFRNILGLFSSSEQFLIVLHTCLSFGRLAFKNSVSAYKIESGMSPKLETIMRLFNIQLNEFSCMEVRFGDTVNMYYSPSGLEIENTVENQFLL